MAKSKTNKLFKNNFLSRLPKLAVFLLAFAAIGSYFVFKSFALDTQTLNNNVPHITVSNPKCGSANNTFQVTSYDIDSPTSTASYGASWQLWSLRNGAWGVTQSGNTPSNFFGKVSATHNVGFTTIPINQTVQHYITVTTAGYGLVHNVTATSAKWGPC